MNSLLAIMFATVVLSSDVWSALVLHQSTRSAELETAMLPGGTALTLYPELQSGQPATYIPKQFESHQAVQQGKTLFDRDWGLSAEHRPLLGPRFDRPSCVACHVEAGIARTLHSADRTSPEEQVRIVRVLDDAHLERFGNQFTTQSVSDSLPRRELVISDEMLEVQMGRNLRTMLRKPIGFAIENDEAISLNAMSIRTAPALFGWGLLSEVATDTLYRMADVVDADADGISGRVSQVSAASIDEQDLPGRFGWKAEFSTLKAQIAAALHNDMGITSGISTRRHCDSGANQAQEVQRCAVEIDDNELDAMLAYVRYLGVPDRRDRQVANVMKGEELFERIACSSCHVPVLKTGRSEYPEFSEQVIWPYSDLLLHDMGPGLADPSPSAEVERVNGEPTHREWRTTPLWGIGGLARMEGRRFLHDGRASSLTEAILWHGGEATGSVHDYLALDADESSALLEFLESL